MTKQTNIVSIPQHIQDAVAEKFREDLDCYTQSGGFMKSCYENDDFFIEVTADVVIDKYETWGDGYETPYQLETEWHIQDVNAEGEYYGEDGGELDKQDLIAIEREIEQFEN